MANVIERLDERTLALREAWRLAQRVLVVAARLTMDARGLAVSNYHDGILTKLGTFQKYFDQGELRGWIDQSLAVSSVPVAPGVFYVFRDPLLRESFIASRYRRRSVVPRLRRSEVLVEQHRPLFDALLAFVTQRGRLPDMTELPDARPLAEAVGSLPRAFATLRRVTDTAALDRIKLERTQDLLLYLALARFEGRPLFSALPHDMQMDVRAFCGTYAKACTAADELLFSAGDNELVDRACRTSTVGKVTPSALYIHTSGLSDLTPVLRIYEGCARAYIGRIEGSTVIKLNRGIPQISYLAYPTFDTDPHPQLYAAVVVALHTFRVQFRDYRESGNPPILHRKEELVPHSYPLRSRFERLTRQEERYGLYSSPESIGTMQGWQTALTSAGLMLRGHRVVKRKGERTVD